jgi:peptide/nickel transport system substrate-binding protein
MVGFREVVRPGRRGASSARIAILAAFTIVVAGCTSQSTPTHATTSGSASFNPASCKNGGTLTLVTDIEPQGVNPALGNSDSGSEQTYPLMFDTLVENVGTTPAGDLVPGLAASWTISPDGLTYTFKLRDGVKFADGTPLTSADVQFTFQQLLSPSNPQGGAYSFIKSVAAPDPSTFVINLNTITPALLGWLSPGWMGVVPKAYYQKVGAAGFTEHPIGTGPFKLTSWQRGQQASFTKNPYYWRTGQPHFDGLVVQYIPNDNTRVLNVTSGAADIAIDVPFSQLDSLSHVPGTNLLLRNISTFFPLLLNNSKKPFDEMAVRQALNYATPKDTINQVVFSNHAFVVNSTIPPLQYWDKSIKPYPYDLDKARQLLKTTSVPNGFSMNLNIVGTDQAEVLTAGIIQQSWAQIGVKVNIVQTDLGSNADALVHETYDGLLQPPTNSNSDIPQDDELALYVNTPTPIDAYFTHYNNPEVTALVKQATSSPSESERHKLFSQIQQDTVTNPPYVLMVNAPVRALIRDDIAGFDFISTYWYLLGGVCRTS